MDRLFLAGLVREIASAVRGARLGSVRIGDSAQSMALALNKRGAPGELVFQLSPGAAGMYTRDRDDEPARAHPREAKLEKLMASSVIDAVEIAELDRVVTVTLEQTRLSGKKRRIRLVLELVAAQRTLYVVDGASGGVVDALSVGASRLAVGEPYRALDPPPLASLPPADGGELERRIEVLGGALDRDTLLSATGWTPLLVKEMRFRIDANGETPAAAFEALHLRLRAERPMLYLDPARPAKVLLSPIELDSETSLVPRAMASFDEAMAEAIRVSVDARRRQALDRRLSSALTKRAKRVRSLRDKLASERGNLPETDELRQRGESLLAGLARAERIDDTHVRVPDPFHPDGETIDIEIDPRFGVAENAQRLFRRSRKVERTEVELGKRLETLERELDYLETVRVGLGDAATLDELASIEREMEDQDLLPKTKGPSRPAGAIQRLPPRSYTSARGNTILVGRSARSNAELTFKVAKPDDLWLHASGVPGSHVVLKDTADEDEIVEAAGYAAHFSKARNDAYVDVIVTERRNVRSIKAAPPGLVRVDNVRTVRVRPTPPPEEPDEIG